MSEGAEHVACEAGCVRRRTPLPQRTPRPKRTRRRTVERMAEKLTRGDEVSWHTHGTETEGTVEKKITSDTEAAGRTVRASADDPQYLVKSAKSGREAVHKPEALTKTSKTPNTPNTKDSK